ncbi:synaptonemal complex protein 2-like [Protopterus annectens]|uniref:synaptonemal complex protein 2-like n=1 Tax=Protopterus annectens TaxID=7888 RepID=UPI001CFB8C6F|nr:synaptonemal complex protein 2-like [Protopterus annectens]
MQRFHFEACIKKWIVPRGLRILKMPTTGNTYHDLLYHWQQLNIDLSIRYMVLLNEYFEPEEHKIQKLVRNQQTELYSKFKDIAIEPLFDRLIDSISLYEKHLLEQKKSKLQRDLYDFSHGQIFTWPKHGINNGHNVINNSNVSSVSATNVTDVANAHNKINVPVNDVALVPDSMLLLTDVPPLLKTLTETDSNASECTKSSTINELEQKEDEHSCAEDNQTETTEELLLTDVPPLLKTLTETDSNASECTKSSTINELEQKEDEHSCAEDNQTETTEEIVNIENNQAKAVSPTQDAEKSMHALSPAQSVAPASVTKPQLNDDDMDSVSDMFASHFSSTTPVASTGTSTSQSTVKAAKNTEKGTETITEPHDSLSTQTAETDVDNSKKEDFEEVSHSQNLEPSVNYVKDQTPTELRSDSEKNVRKKRKRDEFELDSATSPEHSESVRQAKTKVFGEKLQSERSLTRTSVKVKPRSSERTKQSRSSKKHLFSESSNEASSGSEKSWISENQKKTSSRILDYSRSKPKPKSKLKVLPLSSGNSTDEEKSSKLVASDSIQKTIKNSFNSELDIRSLTPIKRVKSSTSPTKSEKEPSDMRDLASPATLCDEDKISSENAPQNDLADILSITASPLQATTLVEDVTVILQEQTHESTPVNLDDEPVNISTLEFGLQKRKAFGSQEDIGVPSTSTPLPGLKPRKLFASSEKKQKSAEDTPDKVAEETAFYDDLHSFDDDAELSDASIITAFSNFSEQLKKTFLSRHKKMEIHMQNCMKDSQQHVTTLLTELHNCRLQKLDNFQNTVTQELANLEKDAQTLMQLEKTTLDFWKTQTLNVRTFCIQQQQRLKSMTSLLGEPFRSATDMLPQTKAKEGENMPQSSAN